MMHCNWIQSKLLTYLRSNSYLFSILKGPALLGLTLAFFRSHFCNLIIRYPPHHPLQYYNILPLKDEGVPMGHI